MTDTSASLLDRVRRNPRDEAWERLVAIYSPLIRTWLRREVQVDAHDADDIAQEVLAVVLRRIPEFERQRTGSFRAWLKAITINCLRRSFRDQRQRAAGTGDSQVQDLLNQLEDPQSQISSLWDREHDEFVMKQLLQMIRPQFAPKTWQAFERVALEGVSPADVAAELGMTVNAVFIARSRVMARLRQEADGLID